MSCGSGGDDDDGVVQLTEGDDDAAFAPRRVEYISVDASMRIRLASAALVPPGSRMEPLMMGEPLTGPVVARVVESKSPEFKPGDLVGYSNGEWADYNVRPAGKVRRLLPGTSVSARRTTRTPLRPRMTGCRLRSSPAAQESIRKRR